MTVHIQKGVPCGRVSAPPSKSMAHRYLICAGLAKGESVVRGLSFSQDILATIDCLRALGATITLDGNVAYVKGAKLGQGVKEPLVCRECGTTLRLMLPLCLLGGGKATLTGSEKLLSRPLGAYETLCQEKGFFYEKGKDYVAVEGQLTPDTYYLPGNVSSQYISGLLYALATLSGESEIVLTTEVESRSYIDLTLQALGAFGIACGWKNEQTLVVTGGAFTPCDITVEGDWSNGAFWLAMKAMGAKIEVDALEDNSLQGDRVCQAYFDRLVKGNCTLSIGDCPDLAPILMVVSAMCHGSTLTDTARLKLKESDRGVAMKEELAKCGVEVEVKENEIFIFPSEMHTPQKAIDGHNDHRIVMAMAVLLSYVGGDITGAEAVTKSYPDFFTQMKKLGIENDYGAEH